MEIPTYEFEPLCLENNYIVAPYVIILPRDTLFSIIDKTGDFDEAIVRQLQPILMSRYYKSFDMLRDNVIESKYRNKSKDDTDIDSIVVIFIKSYSNSTKVVILEVDDTKNHKNIIQENDIYNVFNDVRYKLEQKFNVKYLDINAIIHDDTLFFELKDEEVIDDQYKTNINNLLNVIQ